MEACCPVSFTAERIILEAIRHACHKLSNCTALFYFLVSQNNQSVMKKDCGTRTIDDMSCIEPHYESEAKCNVFDMKIIFHSYANKTNFHMKSFALSLAFIVRFIATRKWPIETYKT